MLVKIKDDVLRLALIRSPTHEKENGIPSSRDSRTTSETSIAFPVWKYIVFVSFLENVSDISLLKYMKVHQECYSINPKDGDTGK